LDAALEVRDQFVAVVNLLDLLAYSGVGLQPARESGSTLVPPSGGNVSLKGQIDRLSDRVPQGAAGMTPENRLTLIIETIRAIRIGAPVSKGGVTLLLEPWPDLYWDAMDREGMGWINLLQAAAARIELAPE
jgi:hypothetical protein